MGASVLMNWEDIGTAAVSSYFGLDPASSAAVSLARMSARRFGPGFGPKRARVEQVGAPIGIPNVIPGGMGHYMGDFRKTSVSVAETNCNKYGYKQEQELYGSLSMNNVQYLTVQSVNLQMIIRGVSTAFARMLMWKHYKQTYTTTSEYLFPQVSAATVNGVFRPDLYNIKMFIRSKTSSGPSTDSGTYLFPFATGITATTTLEDLVTVLSLFFTSTSNPSAPGAHFNDVFQFTGYQFVYSSDNSVSPASTITYWESPRWSIDNQMISVSVKQVIHLQNVTRGDVGTNPSAYSVDAIDANPIVGKVFHMHGIYPDVEYQPNNVQDVNNFAFALQRFTNVPHNIGIGVPDINPTGEWRSIPRPQNFANIISCQSGLRLEPGSIKKDVLHFRFNGRLNDLFRGLSYLGTGAGPTTSEFQPVYASSKLGNCKLFAFEKVVPTGQDAVEMNYHIDRYVSVIVPPSWEVLSIRREHLVNKFDLKLGTVALAASDVVAADDLRVTVAGVDGDDPLTDA